MATRHGDRYDKYTSSYSGADMQVMFSFPGVAPVLIGTASTITYSIYRQLAHVRTLGRISSKGYARGGRTCAGTIIFTVINESFVEDLRDRISYIGAHKTIKPDELPPFDIVLTFGNEFGQTSSLIIYGASFTDETKTLSVEDIFTENILTFMARDIQHMRQNKDNMIGWGSGTFRGNDEDLGKFTLAELIATQEAEARQKRLEELARMEKERWEEPVMTDPGNMPSDTAGAGSGGGTPTAPGTPGEGIYGKVKIRVYESYTTKDGAGSRRALAGATVYYNDPMNGGKISATTDKDGYASFVPKYDIKFNYTATKSGYSSASKDITVKKSDGTKTYDFVLNKTLSGGGGGYDPDGKESVVYTNYNGPDKYKQSTYANQTIKSVWAKDQGPMVKLTNAYGNELSGIPVTFSYIIHNSDDCPLIKKPFFRMAWSKDKGDLGLDYSSKYGNARIPVFAFNDLFDGCIIQFIAKPYIKKDPSEGMTDKSLWKSWYFIKDNGGL
jgi:hypothetical protein